MLNVVGYLLEVTSLSGEAAIVSVRVAYMGAPFPGILLYLFSLDYTGRKRPRLSIIMLLLGIGAVFTVSAFAYPWIPALYSNLSFSTEGLLPHLVVTPGPLYYLCFIYIAIFTILALINFSRSFITEKRYEGAPIFLVGIFLPLLAQVVAFTGLIDGWNPVRLAMTLCTLFLAIFMARYRQAEWQSRGRELVVQEMQDAFILIDNNGFVLDYNCSAQEYFPGLAKRPSEQRLTDLWDFPAEHYEHHDTYQFELERGGALRNLKVSTTPLEAAGKITGTCVIINDDTANHHMLEELSRLARRDELTGLNNRATFFRDASQSFDLACRSGNSFGCALMMDIDFFKNVNDTYGHAVGDEVLRFIGTLLLKRFRHTDICGRYGGEELCVWMPATTLKGALQVSEEIREAVEDHIFLVNDQKFNVTVSIGVASMLTASPIDFDDLIKKADFALYEAKHGGRNRICTYECQPNQT
jgi:diguanylate cyclase (GGDEF)-like protein